VPERLGGFGLSVAAAAWVWPTVVDRTGLGLPCVLRSIAGVPCPACGMTAAAMALARGDAPAAWAANPVVFGLAACVAVALPLLALRAGGAVPPPVPWPAARRRRMDWAIGLLALASWIYQLHRLGVRWA
jgi:hypothetical protein